MLKENDIDTIVEKTVHKIFLAFGVDTSNPEGILALQKDMAHLRTDRLRKDALVNRSLFHVVGVALSAMIAAMILGAVQLINPSR